MHHRWLAECTSLSSRVNMKQQLEMSGDLRLSGRVEVVPNRATMHLHDVTVSANVVGTRRRVNWGFRRLIKYYWQ